MTYMAFKMLCFLVLYKDFFIIKISITIPAPRLQLLLLLATHNCAVPTEITKGGKNKQEKRGEKSLRSSDPTATDRKSVV